MKSFVIYLAAAIAEIGGCYSIWAWLRLGKSVWWVAPGVAALVVFALLLTRVDTLYAGRAFAAYGGIYIIGSLGFLWLGEGVRPDRWDLIGALVLLAGSAIILFGPRGA